jgi:phosphatidylglycerophosphate synthase
LRAKIAGAQLAEVTLVAAITTRIELADVLKSRAVEDPVNLHVHRPIQLLLTRSLVRTGVTPNQITLLSLCAGVGAAACFFVGTRTSLLVGGGLMFSSAILDGVDGMIARLKKMSSETGHALDGAADYFVNLATTAGAIWHLGKQTGHPFFALGLGVVAHLAWAQHLMLYDFHCATYLRFSTGGKHSGGDVVRAAEALARMKERKASFLEIVLMTVFNWQLGNRESFLRKVNPPAALLQGRPVDGAFAAQYVARHRAPMRLWAMCGNAPHMDLMVLAAAFDRFDVYFASRIVLFTLVAFTAAMWERKVTRDQLLPDENQVPA